MNMSRIGVFVQSLVGAGLLIGSLAGVAVAGAWGAGSFENDDALDWANECAAASSAASVRRALESAATAKSVDAPGGAAAIAAAEVVAAAKGKASPKIPPELLAWTKRQPAAGLTKLDAVARKALARVRDPKVSELRQLWDEQDAKLWLTTVAELEARLR